MQLIMKTAMAAILHVKGQELPQPILYTYEWEAGDDKQDEEKRKNSARMKAYHDALSAYGF
jgi:hypothetical protein